MMRDLALSDFTIVVAAITIITLAVSAPGPKRKSNRHG